jgi:predicted esterase YcpF (UPF0227 family)
MEFCTDLINPCHLFTKVFCDDYMTEIQMPNAKVVYFHGYGSNTQSQKIVELGKTFEVIAPEIPIKFDEAIQHLTNFILHDLLDSRLIFVGTSLGGYWAGLMSSMFAVPAVLINPSCEPGATLKRYNNSKLDETELAKYNPLEFKSDAARIILLAKDDDVLDYRIAKEKFSNSCEIKLFENGGHRFNAIDVIAENIIEIEKGYAIP